jgi:hypothetical protein
MKKIEIPVSILLIALVISSCMPTASTLPVIPTATVPQAVVNPPTQTSQPATNTPTQMSQPDTATPTFTTVPNTATAKVITLTPTQEQPQAATVIPASATPTQKVSSPGCNKAGFVSDITVPNGTIVAVTQVFTKTWRLINLGTCSWTPDYQVVLMQGDQPSGYGSFNLGVNVAPGHTVDISLQLTAPSDAGIIGGSYRLQSPDGVVFGVGQDGNSSFGYMVEVHDIETPAPFQVTSVSMSINASSVSITCPPGKKFVFTAKIKVNAPGTVTYHWVFSDGGTTNDQDITYDEEGTQSISTSWTLGNKKDVSPNPFSGWAQIYIDSPNHQGFGRMNFTITCTP